MGGIVSRARVCRQLAEKEKPSTLINKPLGSGDALLIRSHSLTLRASHRSHSTPVRSVLFGLGPCSSRMQRKCPMGINHRAFSSGDVLLSHGLSPYYHWGCSVSLPCSEWERVGPLRYCHQSAEPRGRFRCCRSETSAMSYSGDRCRCFKRTVDSLITTYRSSFRLRTADTTTKASFCFEIFCLVCLPFREARNGLTEK